jgi:hypothetical protein
MAYVKGASQILTKCRLKPSEKANQEKEMLKGDDGVVEAKEIDSLGQENICRTMIFYAKPTKRFALVDFNS